MRQQNDETIAEKVFYALGTINLIKIFDHVEGSVIDLAVERVHQIEQRMSAFLPGSDIFEMNKNAGNGYTRIHKETFRLLERGNYFEELTGGAFNMMVRPLVELWGIGKKGNYVPEEKEIKRIRKLVDYKSLLLDKKNCLAALKHPGQALDLGGIAKGYAADEVKRILTKNKVKNALINLGGNVLTLGQHPDGDLWRIGIQNPLKPTGSYLGTLSMTDKTIVTSGCNERFFMKGGIRYHHILDPRTGSSARSSLLSVTVVADCSTDADALTTALFVLGLRDGIPLLRRQKAEAIFITENLGIYLTDGLKNLFSIKQDER